MVTIYPLSGVRGLTEDRIVMLASRAAAIALAAAVAVLLSLLGIETPDEGLGAPIVNVFLSAPLSRAPEVRVVRPRPRAAEAEVASVAVGQADD